MPRLWPICTIKGGAKSITLYRISKYIFILAHNLHMALRVKHIPGEKNALADLLSRKDKANHTEWTLKKSEEAFLEHTEQ